MVVRLPSGSILVSSLILWFVRCTGRILTLSIKFLHALLIGNFTGIFDSQDKIIRSAKLTFGSRHSQVHGAERFTSPKNMTLQSGKRFDFSVDVAKSVLLMCAAVYERDRSWVKDALTNPDEAMHILLRLLRSEEPAHQLAYKWGLEFVSIAGGFNAFKIHQVFYL